MWQLMNFGPDCSPLGTPWMDSSNIFNRDLHWKIYKTPINCQRFCKKHFCCLLKSIVLLDKVFVAGLALAAALVSSGAKLSATVKYCYNIVSTNKICFSFHWQNCIFQLYISIFWQLTNCKVDWFLSNILMVQKAKMLSTN